MSLRLLKELPFAKGRSVTASLKHVQSSTPLEIILLSFLLPIVGSVTMLGSMN